MTPAAALERLGGIAPASALLELTTRRSLRRSLRHGTVLRLSRGRYALPTADDARRAAATLSGVVCLRSAAAVHGWELKATPPQPEVCVRRGRKITPDQALSARTIWMNLADDQVEHGVTTPLRTVIDCARRLPFDEALAIADSALRSGLVTVEDLGSVAVAGAGAGAVRRVLAQADARAANPFESVLRALCLDAGLVVTPQAPVDLGTGVIHPDLVCRERRLVMEADSWTHHATRTGHSKDCARYNLLTLRGWQVYRFTWEQVMHQQQYVRWVLDQLVRGVERPEVSVDLGLSA